MVNVGTREQLAARLVQSEGTEAPGRLVIHGSPGDWSVCVSDRLSDGYWLALERRQSVMRCFKTLDAAHAAAMAVWRMTNPSREFASVEVCMRGQA